MSSVLLIFTLDFRTLRAQTHVGVRGAPWRVGLGNVAWLVVCPVPSGCGAHGGAGGVRAVIVSKLSRRPKRKSGHTETLSARLQIANRTSASCHPRVLYADLWLGVAVMRQGVKAPPIRQLRGTCIQRSDPCCREQHGPVLRSQRCEVESPCQSDGTPANGAKGWRPPYRCVALASVHAAITMPAPRRGVPLVAHFLVRCA